MENGISIVMTYHNRRNLLLRTLESINKTNYDKAKIQIIIINDNSSEEHYIDDLNDKYNGLYILVLNIGIKQKIWINSCVPYNIGFNHIKYDKVIIQNPECYHQGDIITDVSKRLNDNLYLSYSCYSLTWENTKLEDFNTVKISKKPIKIPMSDGWYNHSEYRPVFFHFCSAIYYDDLEDLNGFDERYKDGIAFDDNEIIERLKYKGMDMKIIDGPFVFHQAHHSIYHYNKNTPEEEKKRKNQLYFKNKDIFDNITKKERNYNAIDNKYFNKN